MPFQLTDPRENKHILTIDYNGKEWRYGATMYHFSNDVETWYLKPKDQHLLTFTYDRKTKELKQFFLHPGRTAPETFLEALRKELQERIKK